MSAEKTLIKHLVRNYKSIGNGGRPVLNVNDSVNVEFGLGLIQMDLDEKYKVLTMSMWSRYVSIYPGAYLPGGHKGHVPPPRWLKGAPPERGLQELPGTTCPGATHQGAPDDSVPPGQNFLYPPLISTMFPTVPPSSLLPSIL